MADLSGRTIAFLEGRRAVELASLIERHNGVPLAAPCLREVHRADAPELQAALRDACAAPLDVAIFLTGVGTRTLFEAAALAGLETVWRERLAQAAVVVRGPKPAAALRELGIRIDVSAPSPHTSAEVLTALVDRDVRAQRVLLQLYGDPRSELAEALESAGARVIELLPYTWEPPSDPTPVLRLLDALDRGAVDALLVTSQAQVEHLFGIAQAHGREPALRDVSIGVQGPVVEAALQRRGYGASFRPEHGHMGALVLAAARHFQSQGVGIR